MKKLSAQLSVVLSILTFLMAFPTSVQAATPRTSTVWASTGKGGIMVTPYVRNDRKALFVDFDHFNSTMDYIYYNLNYTDRNTGVKGGVQGSFITQPLPVSGVYAGLPFVRRQLLFGTCSKNSCVYNTPKNVVLTVNTHFGSAKLAQVTRVLNFPDNQF